ncbi:expressed unknown protein [Seminavis robusta]|uniref:Uncharacterized protein n=1 Tax=Seminavis robusta TaxID=568900 RepID=A0A9N8F0K2_9STRA|nr:expressed unknown protein [Seminavis robusta]|eukprot:Sro2968_g341170.1 n/a (193) ;mRNA; r:4220-4798
MVAINKIIGTCCGTNELVSTLMSHLPFGKNNDEEQAEEVKPNPQQKPQNKPNKKKKGKFTDKEMKYELTMWKDLPLKVRKAAKELGYEQESWDSSSLLPIGHKHWHALTEDERKAVEALGWEKEAWEKQYQETAYGDLPELQKKAAAAVGITDDHTWHHWPHDLEHSHWDDLKDEQKQAMAVFGWTKSEWDH